MNYSQQQQKSPGSIRRLFSGLWTLITWVRLALLNLIFLLILIVVIIAFNSKSTPVLPQEFALRLAPTGLLVDQRSYMDPISLLLSDVSEEDSETLVRDLVEAINYAAEDKRVTALVLELDLMFGGGISKMQEVGQALANFKATGKKIFAFGSHFTQDQYYLASYADQIYLNDMGGVLLTGYGSYRNYYKGALDKLDINYHVFRSGKYKDAIEPYLREDMSPESKEHNAQWLNELWIQYTGQVESARALPSGAINAYINEMDVNLKQAQGDSAALALTSGLVDGLKNYNEAQQLLIEKIGKSDEGNFYRGVDIDNYLTDVKRLHLPKPDKIGLLVASGTILDGKQPDGNIGSHSMAEMLQQIREEKNIKALVLRIDSGGGSAFASEVIRAEIIATREAGIPVFISMGSLAASGGYWIATAGDEIWATPTTLTGSIGVYGAFPTLEKTLANIGLTTDGVGTTDMAGAIRLDRELSPKASAVIQLGVDHIYQRFIRLVAEARDAKVDDIDKIAQGHVWGGTTAKDLGLVDNLGTLDDTIAAAAQHLDLKEYDVELIQRPLSTTEALLRELMESEAGSLAPKTLLGNFTVLEVQQSLVPLLKPLVNLGKMNDPQAIYAVCMECVVP